MVTPDQLHAVKVLQQALWRYEMRKGSADRTPVDYLLDLEAAAFQELKTAVAYVADQITTNP